MTYHHRPINVCLSFPTATIGMYHVVGMGDTKSIGNNSILLTHSMLYFYFGILDILFILTTRKCRQICLLDA